MSETGLSVYAILTPSWRNRQRRSPPLKRRRPEQSEHDERRNYDNETFTHIITTRHQQIIKHCIPRSPDSSLYITISSCITYSHIVAKTARLSKTYTQKPQSSIWYVIKRTDTQNTHIILNVALAPYATKHRLFDAIKIIVIQCANTFYQTQSHSHNTQLEAICFEPNHHHGKSNRWWWECGKC